MSSCIALAGLSWPGAAPDNTVQAEWRHALRCVYSCGVRVRESLQTMTSVLLMFWEIVFNKCSVEPFLLSVGFGNYAVVLRCLFSRRTVTVAKNFETV